MTNKHLSIFNQLRPVTVGFDNVFDHFERMFEDDIFSVPSVNYPPYNIVKTGKNTYDIEVALAGFSKDDIEVEYAENMLTIKSKTEDKSNDADKDGVIHRGISKRYFSSILLLMLTIFECGYFPASLLLIISTLLLPISF